MALSIPALETLNLADGTSVVVTQTPYTTAEEWAETKKLLEESPEDARKMEAFSKDAKAIKTYMQQKTLLEYYDSKFSSGDEVTMQKVLFLDRNPEFAHVFDDVKKGGVTAALQHSYNEPLMMKVSRAVGGIPEDVKARLSKVQAEPTTLHEACKMGSVTYVEEFLKTGSVTATDAKGVTPLGYAIGANRVAVVKLLLDKKADASKCDEGGANAVHYAAAYGRKELLTCLIDGKVDLNAKNAQGQTPLAVATKNKQSDAVDILSKKGGQK